MTNRKQKSEETGEIKNRRVRGMTPIDPPARYLEIYPATPEIEHSVNESRRDIERIISGYDDRLLVISGPCSIHDTNAGVEYASRLADLSSEIEDRIMVVMRTYFEKPRTTVGWKGLLNQPYLDGKSQIGAGLATARQFLLEVCAMGVPTATEWLESFTPQYLGDLVSWAAIGARTSESQPHRMLASGLSMPVGFKNGSSGDVQVAVDGIVTALYEHSFLGITGEGVPAEVETAGNSTGHLVLRGGKTGPNYGPESVSSAIELLEKAGLPPYLVIDCSHANSNKDYTKQPAVFQSVLEDRVSGNRGIAGIMLESNLNPGSQSLGEDPCSLEYGVSITDSCIGWEQTESLLRSAYSKL